MTAETAPGIFALTPFGQPLRKNAPNSVWPAVVFWSDLLADNWSYLTDCVRTGNAAGRVMENQGVASRWSKDRNAGAIFRAVMGTAPAEDYMPIARSWDFAERHVVADLGGGGGSLLCAVLRNNPHLSGMLVDRQPSIDAATQHIAARGLTARCRLIAADLGEAVPSGADVYLIKHVLHGCQDDAAIKILTNCRAVIPPGGLSSRHRVRLAGRDLSCRPKARRASDERSEHDGGHWRQRTQRAGMDEPSAKFRL